MKTIRLHGKLAEFVGHRILKADVSSVAEAVAFLVANFPHVEKHMIDRHYWVRAGKRVIDSSEVSYPVGTLETISFTPVVCGAGAIGRIIAGALLITASFFLAGVAILGIAISPVIFSIGASLVLGGIAQLLAPPTLTSARAKDPTESYIFSGISNNSRQGLPIPIIYGETIVGSITVSAGISVEAI